MKENNFPIKYALQPIRDQLGWEKRSFGLEPEYEFIFYVISKCYLVGESIKYYGDGSKKQYYEVVYPYKDESIALLNKNVERNYPEFNYKNTCYNQDYTYKIYDSYHDALNDRIVTNKKQVAEYLATLQFNSNLYINEKEILNRIINNIDELEIFITENTEDLIIESKEKVLKK